MMEAARPRAAPGERRSAMGEADRDSTAAYNYPRFDEYVAAGGDLADEDAFWASPRVGRRAPDFTLPRLGDGAGVRLSDLWRSRPLVMEFGSFT
jgi:hypothetical protein